MAENGKNRYKNLKTIRFWKWNFGENEKNFVSWLKTARKRVKIVLNFKNGKNSFAKFGNGLFVF